MQRAAFVLTGLVFAPVGAWLYFLSPGLATQFGVSPLWLARVAGGVLLAWGVYQWAAGAQPDNVKVGGLVGGNLLTAATLVPAVLRLGDGMPGPLRTILLVLSALLTALAVAALLSAPPRRRL